MSESFNYTIQFPDSSRVQYSLPSTAVVHDMLQLILKDPNLKIKDDNPEPRILYMGRFLKPSTKVADINAIADNPVLNLVLIKKNKNGVNDTNNDIDLVGFDRLRRFGVSADVIERVRSEFHAIHHSTSLPENERLEQEEEWFPLLFSQQDDGTVLINGVDINEDNLGVNGMDIYAEEEEVELSDEETYGSDTVEDEAEKRKRSKVIFVLGFVLGLLFGFRLIILLFLLLFASDESAVLGYFYSVAFVNTLKEAVFV